MKLSAPSTRGSAAASLHFGILNIMQRLTRVTRHLASSCSVAGAEVAEDLVGDRVTVTITVPAADEPIDGRLILMVSREQEPMRHVGFMDALQETMMAGVDVDALAPGETIIVTGEAVGFPLATLGELPQGAYYVQAVLNRYETFNLSTGHTVKLPPGDQGDGQSWRKAPGNFFCEPVQVELGHGASLSLCLDQVMPPIDPPKDTEYIKHVTIVSKRLTEFWGREIKLGAHVLLPEGFVQHPDARYPLALFHVRETHTQQPPYASGTRYRDCRLAHGFLTLAYMVDHRAISLQILVASDRSPQIPRLSQISSLGLAYQATTKYSSKSTTISTSAGPQKGFHAFYALKFSTQHLTMYAGFDAACDIFVPEGVPRWKPHIPHFCCRVRLVRTTLTQ